jgi:hypothetical protein
MPMRSRWLAVVLVAVTALILVGCASSRRSRYGGPYGTYPGIYGPANRGIYVPRRDYRWEMEQRRRAEWRREQRRQERRERDRDRWRYRRHRD